eukprot:4401219-Prymnesium_polylepis.1
MSDAFLKCAAASYRSRGGHTFTGPHVLRLLPAQSTTFPACETPPAHCDATASFVLGPLTHRLAWMHSMVAHPQERSGKSGCRVAYQSAGDP